MPFLRTFHWLKHGGLWLYKLTTFAVLAAGFSFAAVVLGLRYYLLPQIDSFRADIEAVATRALGAPVKIARIDADWEGLRPQLKFRDLRLADREGRTALVLPEVDATVSWRSMLLMQPIFHSLEIQRPTLLLRRDPNGTIWVAGLRLDGGGGDEGFGDSLLKHRQIIILGATLLWQDEKLGAPELKLTNVALRLDSRGHRHRFGLRAVPPPELAAPLDVRGDLRGDRLSELARWDGKLYAELAYTDLARWRQWLPLAALPSHGAGAIRAWLDVANGAVEQATGDVRLAGVRTRLGDNLPELALERVNGRLGWKRSASRFEVAARELVFTIPGATEAQPLDLLLKRVAPGPKEPGRLEVRVNAVDLGLLANVADRLPFDEEIRRELVSFDPQGRVKDFECTVTGPFDQPTSFRVKGRFEGLGVRPAPRWPGFAGLDGSLEATEKGGVVTLKSRDLLLDAPTVLHVPVAFDTVDAQAVWAIAKGRLDLKVSNLAFANRDIAGSFKGSYERNPGSTGGVIDATGELSRLDPQVIGRYLPLIIGGDTRRWLDQAFLGGLIADAKLKLKGDLAGFPWPDGKSGQFSVQAKLEDVDLQFADSWPPLDKIKGTLSFRGESVEVTANAANIAGVPLMKVRGVIKDLFHGNERLEIAGQGAGTTTQFLDFIDSSPVGELIGHFNRDMRATGSGKLDIKLDVPLRASRDTRVVGTYQFIDNRLLFSGDVPPLDQVNAKLDFTETGITMQNGTATAVGGPATVNIGTQGGTVTINTSGRADVDAFRRQTTSYFWLPYFRGGAAWRGSITLRKGLTDYVFESDLQGIGSTLPAPLAKVPADVVPARFERRAIGPDDDRMEITFGKEVNAVVERRRSDGVLVPVRGVIALDVPAALPDSGLAIVGTARELNMNRWFAVIEEAPAGSGVLPLSQLDVNVGALQLLRRPFTDMRVKAALKNGLWQGSLAGPDVAGDFSYALKDNGKLKARLTRLTLPDTDDTDKRPAAAASPGDRKERPPDLDVVAEAFRLGDREFGRLDVKADLEGQDWRIDKLQLDNPDATLNMVGRWRSWLAEPRTDVTVELDVVDAGKFLKRLGYPEGIKGGKSRVAGKLAWNGKPQDLDLATLSGDLTLEAQKGQFVKLEPGIAKLLGVISLQSLPRRISLDFGDIFSTGLAFDSIAATVKITEGIAATDDFLIRSPSASIGMTGDVNLAAETQDLRVRVVPFLGEGVALGATALGGPIAGVAALALQKLLRDPIGQMMAFEYAVTGTWSDPQVSKVDRLRGQQQTPPG